MRNWGASPRRSRTRGCRALVELAAETRQRGQLAAQLVEKFLSCVVLRLVLLLLDSIAYAPNLALVVFALIALLVQLDVDPPDETGLRLVVTLEEQLELGERLRF